MALLPVATSRVSTPLSNQRLLFQLNADQLAIQRQYDQLSSGRRVLRASDDPAAAARALGLQSGISLTEQLIRNADATQAYHASSDSALSRINDTLIDARSTAIEAAQNVISDQERETLAQSLGEAVRAIVAAGNAMFNDHQLLGGILQPKEALQPEGNAVRFDGSFAVGQTKTGATTPTLLNVTGEQAIGLAQPLIRGEPLDAALNADTRLVDLRQGIGVRPGVIRLSDGSNIEELDLLNAATIGDVNNAIRNTTLGGRPLSVVQGPDSISIRYADGLPGTLIIADLPGSTLAEDLQIANPLGFRPQPIVGDRLAPRVTLATPLTELGGGVGLDLDQGLVIDRGTQRVTIDFDDARTIGDVLIKINRSGAGVRAELDQAEGRIVVRGLYSGADYSIGENGGFAATQLGIRSATEQTPISELARQRGLSLNPAGPDLIITRPDGRELSLELSGVETIADVIDLVANHPDNQDTRRVLMSLSSVGNGLQLAGPPGVLPIRVRQVGTSDAGVQLGLIPAGQSEAVGETISGFAQLLGTDYRPLEARGAIDTLLRLEQAVRIGDIPEIGRLQARLDVDLDQSTRTQGRVGIWSRTVTDLSEGLQDENVLLQSQLSNSLDADLAKVISDLTARQASLEASMRFIGQTAGLTVLNYL